MSKLAWLSVDSVPATTRKLAIEFPDSDAWLALLRGALLPLCYEANFEQLGALTPLEMADVWTPYILDFFSEAISMFEPGMIMPFGGSSPPGGWLLCDGATYEVNDYPALAGVLAGAYGTVEPGYFQVPDLRGRFPLGKSPSRSMGAFGGTESHVLATSEIPSHNHTQVAHDHTSPAHSHKRNPDQLSETVFHGTVGSGSFGSATGNRLTLTYSDTQSTTPGNVGLRTATNNATGGGGAHNNMPPYQVVQYIIKT